MFINELDAFCIAMPADLCPFTAVDHLRYLAVVGNEAALPGGSIEYRVMGTGIPAEPATSLIRRVCVERAVDTVDGTLRVQGARLTPEAYIQRWRQRLAAPLTLGELAVAKGLQTVAVFEWRHSEAIGQRKAGWVNAPFPNFQALLLALGQPPASGAHWQGELTRLEIDLAGEHGARNAWWVDDWLCALSQGDTVQTRRVELRPVPPTAQQPLQRSYNLRVAQSLALL